MARAKTTPIDEAAESKQEQPRRNKGGRPRKHTNYAAPGETSPELEAAAQTGAELDENKELDIFELQRAYDPLDWEKGGLFMYLYRTAPVIDRGRVGADFNVQKFSRPTDTDEIMRASYGGSGGYKLTLIRYDPTTRLTKTIRQQYFKILNYDFPPRIPFGEWLDSDNNKEWAWAKPKLQALARQEAAAEQAAAHTAGTPAMQDGGPVLELLRELLPAGRKNEAQAIADEVVQAIQRDQPKTSAGLEAIVLKLIEGKAGGGDDHLRAELVESRRFQNELLLKIAEGNKAAAPRSILAELKELAEAKDVLGAIFGRGGAKSAPDGKIEWPEVGVRIGEKLIEAAGPVMQAIAMRSGIKQPARRTAEVARGAGALPAGVASEVEQETPEEVQEMIANISKQFGPMFDEVTPFLSNYFARGVSGMDFRDWFIQEYGRRSYDGLRQLHPQTIADVIELRKTEAPTEQLRSQLAQLTPKEQVLHFIAQFLSDEASEFTQDDDDTPEVSQPAPPAPVPNGRARDGGF
jgi:hypothetical protein